MNKYLKEMNLKKIGLVTKGKGQVQRAWGITVPGMLKELEGLQIRGWVRGFKVEYVIREAIGI